MRKDIAPYAGLTRLCLANDIARHGWIIGDHTYGLPNVIEKGAGLLKIGRFCSIAAVKIILGNHVSSFATTYPFDSFRGWWPGMDGTSCHTSRGVEIGSDVWLGEDSIILPGARIGHGAIIGAGAVVRESIPPYAIVVGNPGKIVRYRFEPAVIERFLRAAWWDRTDEEINSFLPLLVRNDPDAVLTLLETSSASRMPDGDLSVP